MPPKTNFSDQPPRVILRLEDLDKPSVDNHFMEEKILSAFGSISLMKSALKLAADTFQRWFMPVELAHTKGKPAYFACAEQLFSSFWIESNYMPLLQSAIVKVLGVPHKVKFIFAGGDRGKFRRNDRSRRSSPWSLNRPQTAILKMAPRKMRAPVLNGMNPRNTFDSFVVGSTTSLQHAAALAVGTAPAKTYNPLLCLRPAWDWARPI